jgi:hypothetical protein
MAGTGRARPRPARQEAYKFGKLKAGMVLTVEPGRAAA